jgi:DNA-binding response OmpR family regulator
MLVHDWQKACRARRSTPEVEKPTGVARRVGVEISGGHVLVVDEDVELCGRVGEYLDRHQFRVTAVNSAKQMLQIIGQEAIDLLLLEPLLGDGEGIGLTRSIRETSQLPIVVLSGLVEEADRVMSLELGADDYVTKPFSLRELLARIRAVLRRSRFAGTTPIGDESLRAYRFGGWELNVRLYRLISPAGQRVHLSRSAASSSCGGIDVGLRMHEVLLQGPRCLHVPDIESALEDTGEHFPSDLRNEALRECMQILLDTG